MLELYCPIIYSACVPKVVVSIPTGPMFYNMLNFYSAHSNKKKMHHSLFEFQEWTIFISNILTPLSSDKVDREKS